MTKKTEDAHQSDDIPTYDFFENLNLEDASDLEGALDDFIFAVKSGYFLCWEAVEQKEQGNSLTEVQDKVLTNLINSNDGYTGPFFYINDIARPIEPWYEIAKKMAYHFLQMPFRTHEVKYEVICKGWSVLSDILETHCQGLSLPKGAKTPLDVIPINLLHYLNLQFCFTEELSGIGQEEDWTFENEEQYYRIEDFIQLLREYKESVQYFNFTLEKLLTKIIMPPKDEKIFTDLMMAYLGMNSPEEKLIRFLREENFSETSFLA